MHLYSRCTDVIGCFSIFATIAWNNGLHKCILYDDIHVMCE